jgi:hypothetical protein
MNGFGQGLRPRIEIKGLRSMFQPRISSVSHGVIVNTYHKIRLELAHPKVPFTKRKRLVLSSQSNDGPFFSQKICSDPGDPKVGFAFLKTPRTYCSFIRMVPRI